MNDVQKIIVAKKIVEEYRLGIRTHVVKNYSYQLVKRYKLTIKKCIFFNTICRKDKNINSTCTKYVLTDEDRLCINEQQFPLINKN